MFDGLYDIDWSRFGKHIAIMKESRDIPFWINRLCSVSREERWEAIDFLFGIQQHTGMLVAATPYLLPFVLEVFAQENYPDKAYLLHKLVALASYMMYNGRSPGVTYVDQIVVLRRVVQTYDALAGSFAAFLALLNDADGETRFECAKLLRYFQEQSIEVLDAFMRRLESETHLRVRVVMLRSMGNLMLDLAPLYDRRYDRYQEFIMSRITASVPLPECFAAAELTDKLDWRIDEDMANRIEAVKRTYHLSYVETDDSGDPHNFRLFIY